MKKDIHPKYYKDAKIICACGNSFKVGSTQKEIHVEICSACHPFFTGKTKLVDTAGRVDRFKKIMEKSTVKAKASGKKKDKRKKRNLKQKSKKSS